MKWLVHMGTREDGHGAQFGLLFGARKPLDRDHHGEQHPHGRRRIHDAHSDDEHRGEEHQREAKTERAYDERGPEQ